MIHRRSAVLHKLFLKLAFIVLLLLPAGAAYATSSFTAGIGGIFYRYETGFLSTEVAYLHELDDTLEVSIGPSFGITTREEDGSVEPQFLIPVNLGLNFLFPGDSATFLFGTGLTPVFHINPSDDADSEFLLGPYAKTGFRIPVHEIMSWDVSLQQDLLIGGDEWINTATRVHTGITFSIPD